MDNFLLVFDNVLEEDLVDSLNQAIVNEDFANPLDFINEVLSDISLTKLTTNSND